MTNVVVSIVVAIASAVVSAVVAAFTYKYWDQILIALKGKKLAVLGARGVGKTHLITFLSTGSMPSESKQTVAPEKTPQHRFQLRDLDLKLKETRDVAGGVTWYAEWKDIFDEADVVLYLLRADRLLAHDAEVEARVRDDLRHIGDWLDARTVRPTFFIIGTHCDLDSAFATLSPDREGEYIDSFKNLPTVKELVARGGGAKVVKVVLGSMKTDQGTEVLAYGLFKQVLS